MPEDRPSSNPRADALADFDRKMGFYRSAAESSKAAEDGYLEALAAPELRDESKRQRRWVLLSSVAALLAGAFGIRPTTVQALGLDLSGAKADIIVVGCGAIALYFLVEFYAFARRDYSLWRQRVEVTHRRLWAALQREHGQVRVTFGNSSMTTEHLQDVQSRLDQYAQEPPGNPPRWWVAEHARSLTGWIEVIAPLGIAALAVASVLYALAV